MNAKLHNYFWSLTERFGTGAVSLVGNIVLAALLVPEDFGLVAMLGIFTSLVYALIDCGMSDGLLREARPTDRDFNTMFYFNIAAGVLIGLLFVALSPVVAHFFGRAELQSVMAVLGLGPVFSGLTIAQTTRLRSQLRFRRVALINVGAIVLALTVAIVMAWRGLRYWAMVELQVGFSFFYWLLLVVASRWHLRWEFDTARFKQLWHFGVNLLMSTLVVHLSQNIVAALLGKYYSATQAGFMGQAQKLQQAPVAALESGVSNATYVMMAKENDHGRQEQAFVRVFRIFTLILLLGCALGIVLSRPIIGLIFPDRWLPTVPYLQLLLGWAMVYPVGSYMMAMLKLRDRTAIVRNIIVAERAAIILAALLLWPWGVAAMIAAFTVISALVALCYIWQVSRVTSIPPTRFITIYLLNLLPATLLLLFTQF